jgi:hypothetical protein
MGWAPAMLLAGVNPTGMPAAAAPRSRGPTIPRDTPAAAQAALHSLPAAAGEILTGQEQEQPPAGQPEPAVHVPKYPHPCRMWKLGLCQHGNNCYFVHEGPAGSHPAAAAAAAAADVTSAAAAYPASSPSGAAGVAHAPMFAAPAPLAITQGNRALPHPSLLSAHQDAALSAVSMATAMAGRAAGPGGAAGDVTGVGLATAPGGVPLATAPGAVSLASVPGVTLASAPGAMPGMHCFICHCCCYQRRHCWKLQLTVIGSATSPQGSQRLMGVTCTVAVAVAGAVAIAVAWLHPPCFC